MNSKGFTLIELIMTIAVLALILAIAVPGINNVSQAIRESQRNNVIERIEVAASKYAFDSGETIIFVDELVSEGYIESDDEGNIIDPVNNKRLNCYVVEMEKTSDYYNAKFIDTKNYEKNGKCNSDELLEDSSKVRIETSPSIVTNGWTKGDITLQALSDNINIDCNVNTCEWLSSSGASITGKDKIEISNVTGILNTKYTFQITMYGTNAKRYNFSINLKIDNEIPIIYETNITNKYSYTSTKNVKIVASDGMGSGIAEYYLGLESNGSCNSSSITYQSSNSFTVNENGTYNVCVKDNVGNISKSSIVISYIE